MEGINACVAHLSCECCFAGGVDGVKRVPKGVYLPCNENSSPATRPAALFPPARELRASFQNPSASSHSIPSHIARCTTLSFCGRCRSQTSTARSLFAFAHPSVCPAIHPPSIRPRYVSRELLLLPGALRENTSRPTSKTHEPTFVHGDDRRLQTPRPSFACPAYLLRESRLILLRRLHRWLSFCLTSIPPI